MGGFTFTIGWGQKAETSTERNGNPIEYTIAGNELYYIVIEGMSPVYSTPVHFLWNLNLIAYINPVFNYYVRSLATIHDRHRDSMVHRIGFIDQPEDKLCQ